MELTGLRFGETVLSNGLEYATWADDPVLPFVCESCLTVGCGCGGLAHIVRSDAHLLWMQPYQRSPAWTWRYELEPYMLVEDSALIPMSEWNRVRKSCPLLPPAEVFPRLTNHDLIQLWLQQRPNYAVPQHGEDLLRHLRRQVIASHPWDIPEALEVIAEFLQQLDVEPIELAGAFVAVDPENCNTLYFDAPEFAEFAVSSVRPVPQPVIAEQYVWAPIAPPQYAA